MLQLFLSHFRELKSPICVIREIYEGQDSYEKFNFELDKALDERYETIVIEPHKVGEETKRWIMMGNLLHRTAFTAGLGSAAINLITPQFPPLYFSLCAVSSFCTSIYWLSWGCDPCVRYQVETNPAVLKQRITNYSELTAPAVVLRLKDNTKINWAHRSCCLLAVSLCAFRGYQMLRSN